MVKRRKKIFYALAAIIFSALFIEIILAASGLSISPQEKFYSNIYDHAYELVPGARMPLGNNPDVVLKVNRFGFRGPEINKNKAPDTKRIFCVGDSTTFGHFLDYEKTYCALLSEKLKGKLKSGKNIETINAGIPGTAITEHGYFIKNKVIQFEPDIIVLYTVPSLSPDLVTLGELRERSVSNSKDLINRIKTMGRRFHTYKFLRRIIKGDIRKEALSNMEILKKVVSDPETLEKKRIDHFHRDLLWVGKICSENNIELLLVQNVHKATAQRLADKNALPGTKEFSDYFKSSEGIFAGMTFEYGEMSSTPFLNPYVFFVPRIISEELFFHDGVHPNEKGHEILANEVANMIISSESLSRPD